MKVVDKNPYIAFIHPYDHPLIWQGNSTIIQEIVEDLHGKKPSCIVSSVGVGGLAMGILQGLKNAGWTNVPLLCMETHGAECFHLSVQQKRLVALDKLTSIAKTLGARSVTESLFTAAMSNEFKIITKVLTDREAVLGCVRLADDHGFLVEPSCGVTMASVYSGVLPSILEHHDCYDDNGPIVLIVCGGSDISHEILEDFSKMFNISLKDTENEYTKKPECLNICSSQKMLDKFKGSTNL